MAEKLPMHLSLVENGYHEPLPWWRNPETKDEEFVVTGWKAVAYNGYVHYHHVEQAEVEQWLTEHGYNTGDGYHFKRKV